MIRAHNLKQRMTRIGLDARALIAIGRLTPVAGRPMAAYVAAVELGLPKKSVVRAFWPKARNGCDPWLRRTLAEIEEKREDAAFDQAITDLARSAA